MEEIHWYICYFKKKGKEIRVFQNTVKDSVSLLKSYGLFISFFSNLLGNFLRFTFFSWPLDFFRDKHDDGKKSEAILKICIIHLRHMYQPTLLTLPYFLFHKSIAKMTSVEVSHPCVSFITSNYSRLGVCCIDSAHILILHRIRHLAISFHVSPVLPLFFHALLHFICRFAWICPHDCVRQRCDPWPSAGIFDFSPPKKNHE